MNKKQAQYLLAVADNVMATPENLWNMEYWGRKTECGTVGCALGRAAEAGVVPGLRLVEVKTGPDGEPRTFLASLCYYISYKGRYEGFGAAEAAFGITWTEACFLFDSSKYRKTGAYNIIPPIPREQVADRIREFVKDKQLKERAENDRLAEELSS